MCATCWRLQGKEQGKGDGRQGDLLPTEKESREEGFGWRKDRRMLVTPTTSITEMIDSQGVRQFQSAARLDPWAIHSLFPVPGVGWRPSKTLAWLTASSSTDPGVLQLLRWTTYNYLCPEDEDRSHPVLVHEVKGGTDNKASTLRVGGSGSQ